ncbi:hypothetical protein KJ797_04480, partial [Patescibacteria group bacterium]|nr:hypothetical protein [Patescibacteria group bacterium]
GVTVSSNGNISSNGNLIIDGNSTLTGNATIGGTLAVTGATTLNDNLTIAANKNLTMASGTGIFSQTFSGTSTTSPHSLNYTYSGIGGTPIGMQISATNSPVTTANTLSLLKLTTTDAGILANTVKGLDIDVTTDNVNDTTYAAIFQGGNVGIGTTAPEQKLHISQVNASPKIMIENTESSSLQYPGINITNYNDGNTGHNWIGQYSAAGSKASPLIMPSGRTVGGLGFYAHNGTEFKDIARIFAYTGPNFSATNQEGGIVFMTGRGTGYYEGMRIIASGNVGIGTTTPSSKLSVVGTSGSTAQLFDIASSSGSSYLNVSANGKVGIGTTNSAYTLHVRSINGDNTRLENDGSGNAVLEIQSKQDAQTAINFLDSTGFSKGQVAYYQGTGNNYMRFTTIGMERMRIDSDGNVGIGTTGPGALLHLSKAGTPGIIIDDTGGVQVFFRYSSGTGDAELGSSYGGLKLFAAGVEKVTINNQGNVGIGTTSPGAKLDVSLTDTNNTTVQYPLIIGHYNSNSAADGAGVGITFRGQGSLSQEAKNYGRIDVRSVTHNTAAMDLKTIYGNDTWITGLSIYNGNVGIGTTGPSSKLEVFSGTDATLTLTGLTASGNVASIDFKRNAGTVNATIDSISVGANDRGVLRFHTRNAAGTLGERVRIDTEGNVGIGTTSPAAKLHVVGGGAGATSLATAVSLAALKLDYAGNPGIGMYMGFIQSGGGAYQYIQPANSDGSSSYHLVLNPFGGNVGIGTTGPGYKLQVNVASDALVNEIGAVIGRTATGQSGSNRGVGLAFHDTVNP